METSVLKLMLASCASAPPSGQTCEDTVALSSPFPSWLPLVILAALVLIAVAVNVVRKRRKRS